MTTTLTAAQPGLPVQDIRLAGAQVRNWTPRQFTLSAGEGYHDEMKMRALVADSNPARWRDQSISFRWGVQGSGVDTFNGYISDVQKDQNFQEQPLVTLTMVSPTWKLSQGEPGFWLNRSSESIIREIASRHRLAVVMDPHAYIWPRLAQTNESDWAMIKRIAAAISFQVCAYNGVIRLIDPRRHLARRQAVMRLVKSTNLLDDKSVLLDFQPKATSPFDRSNPRQSWGFLAPDGSPQIVNADGEHFDTSTYIENAARGRLLADSVERNINSWQYAATARVRGTTRIIPGSVVEVVTGLTNVVRDTNDGFWFVMRVKTDASDTAYQSQLTMVRDEVRIGNPAPYVPFWGRSTRPGMRLSGDTWVSNWQDVGQR